MKNACETKRPAPQVVDVCGVLRRHYPNSRLGNKHNALDEFLYIVLSLRTHEPGYTESYRRFKLRFPSWKKAATASERQIRNAIKSGGLAAQKARRIKDALALIHDEFGEYSLRKLRKISVADALRFLLRLPGVGVKSAKCILLFSLDLDVLPVDTHVARVSRRLGWIERTSDHDALEALIPPRLRRFFHVACVMHGREVCRGHRPKCLKCCLSNLCPQVGVVG